jgi:hypothetical protein
MTVYIEPDLKLKMKRKRKSFPYAHIMLVLTLFAAASGIWLLRRHVILYEGVIPHIIFKLAYREVELFFGVFISIVFIPISLIFKKNPFWARFGVLSVSFIVYVGMVIFSLASHGQFLGAQLETQFDYQNNTYYLVSTSDIFTYEQYTVYRCGKSYNLCQRILEPYRVSVIVTDFYISSLRPTYGEFFVEDNQLYLKLADDFTEEHFLILTVEDES